MHHTRKPIVPTNTTHHQQLGILCISLNFTTRKHIHFTLVQKGVYIWQAVLLWQYQKTLMYFCVRTKVYLFNFFFWPLFGLTIQKKILFITFEWVLLISVLKTLMYFCVRTKVYIFNFFFWPLFGLTIQKKILFITFEWVLIMGVLKAFVYRSFEESFDVAFMKNIKNSFKKIN